MTLYKEAGECPLLLWYRYYRSGDCEFCPMDDGVDIGVGWQSHCNHECKSSGIDAELMIYSKWP